MLSSNVFADCSLYSYEKVMIKAKSLFEKEDYLKGQQCLEEYIKVKPNQEIEVMLVRSYLWSKDYDLANQRISNIKNTVERNLLKGDYFWYTDQKENCYRIYDLLETKLFYKNEMTLYRKKACSKKEIATKKEEVSHILAIVQHKFSNSDDLDTTERELTYVHNQREKKLSLELRYKTIEREFTNLVLEDEILAFGAYKSWNFGESYLIYETSFDTDFTYEKMYQVGHLQNIYSGENKKLALGGEYIKREYSDEDVTLINFKSVYYVDDYSFTLLIPDDFNSFLVKGNGNYGTNFFSAWYSAGSGEATRPYLSGGEDSEFTVIGLSYRWKKFKVVPYISYEYKREKEFNHKMIGVGVSYDFE